MKYVQCENLIFSYDVERPILKGLSFSLEEGECVGLIGCNGAGKSTLLKLFVGLLTDYEGSLKISDIPVDKKHMTEIRKKIGYLFQDSENQLFLSTVYEDVAFGPRNYGLTKEEAEEKVEKALSMVELTDLKDRPVYKLSGGQKKLAAIATLLSMEPEMILFDEPSVALDPRNRRNLIRIVRGLPSTKLIASHDIEMIRALCKRTILMYQGEIVYDGDTETLLSDEEMLLKYGL